MSFTRAQVIQALVELRRRQRCCIRSAGVARTEAVRRAFDTIAAESARQIGRLERALRDTTAEYIEVE